MLKNHLRRMASASLLGVMGLAMSFSDAAQVLNDTLITRPFHHQVWQDVLTQAVDSTGAVDFARLRAFPRRLNEYLDQLAAISPDSDPSAFPTVADKTAYWINAHNAVALRLILDRYPVTSLNQVPNFTQNSRYLLGGKGYTLAQLRNKVAAYRPNPQVVFDLTDYTRSAPPLLPRVYTGDTLKQLTTQTLQAIMATPSLVSFERPATSPCVGIKISPYFRQYEQALFTPSPLHTPVEQGIVPVAFQPAGWRHWLQTWTSPAINGSLNNPACAQHVQFMPLDQTLR